MKTIPLSKGKAYAIVDDDDYDNLSSSTWSISSVGYAVHSKWINKKCKQIHMSRFIMNAPKGMHVDHINHNPLDNRKQNLRLCTVSQNTYNKSKYKGTSRYKGVSRTKNKTFPWVAFVYQYRKRHYLGYYRTQEQAAEAYNWKAKELFGEFALLNEV